MLLDLFESFLLGFAVTAVPGAVFFETTRRALEGHRAVVSFLLGNFSGMIIVITLAFLGSSLLALDGDVATLLYVLNGILLLYLGLSALLKREVDFRTSVSSKRQGYRGYAMGVLLGLVNPLSIAFWVSLSAKFLQDTEDFNEALLHTLCVVAGAAILFVALILFVRKVRSHIKANQLLLLSRGFGILLVGYGCIALARAIA